VDEAEIDCPRCGQRVPDVSFCVRCGEHLHDRSAGGGRPTRFFAAAPGESVGRVALFSTLLPQLPQADLDAFRIAFAGGLIALLALVVVGAFPVALVGAAVLVPALIVVYIYSVDVYEHTPLRVVALTMLWGAAWGIAFAVATPAVSHTGVRFGANQLRETVLLGVVVPLAGEVAMLIGPLFLLRDRHYNDVLDGAAFGVASAVAFVGAQVIAGSIDVFTGGLTPVGESLPWVARIVAISVALPVVAAGAIGSTVGAFWLRYRAPIRDRDALGAAGRPAIAVVLAGALIVASALGSYLPGPIIATTFQLAIASIALVWLRRTLHVGLLEEALEIEIGDEIVCSNCGAKTRRHTFCGNCGIALRALPKRARKRPD
jgi:RsiW-degrading membrane proteinase PrsW (M82 family)